MRKNLTPFYRGDTVSVPLTLRDDDGAIDVTGNVFWFTLKLSSDEEDAEAALQVSHTAPANAQSTAGEVTVVAPSSATSSLLPTIYEYDLQRVIPGSPDIVQTLLRGTVVVNDDVTRSTA